MNLGRSVMMKRWSGPRRCGCCDVAILGLDRAPFGDPILALEGSDLEQLFIVLDLVFGVQPTLADNIIICFEDVEEGCRGGRCAGYDSVKKVNLVWGESCEFDY